MERKNNLRNFINQGKLLKIAGAHNALTAKLVEEAGFDGIWSSGLEISTSHAVPDANILTMTDFLSVSNEMANTTSLPIIADCDTGFGNANNVMHMVKKFEACGVAAVCIEDKKFPKVNSFIAGRQELASIAEFAGKIMAAKSAQITNNFMVFARIEALIAGWGLAEALKRAQAYLDAGADAIFIHSKSTEPNEIIEFCKAWKRKSPVLICPTTYYISDEQMKELGINIVIYANQGMRASIKYLKEILDYIKHNGTKDLNSKIVTMDEVFRLQGMHAMKNNEKKYLKTERGSIKAIIPAAGETIDESLKLLLKDKPLCMLEINDKPLLQRNIEIFNMAGIQDINVVVGYAADKIKLEGAKIIKNKEFKTKGIMHSVIEGVDSIADKNLVVYSDIMLDQHFLDKLIKREEDLIIVVDNTYKKINSRNKALELVLAKHCSANSKRVMETGKKNPVYRIGKDLSESEAHFEFIGVALLSRKAMQKVTAEYKKGNFYDSFSFAEFIQEFINRGNEVCAYEVNSGWMEIHTLSDYQHACSVFSPGKIYESSEIS